MSKTYLVTGGAGFIGVNLIEYLLKSSHNIINVDDLLVGNKNNLINSANITNIIKPIQDIENLNIFQNIDGIFHLGAQSSVPVSIENPFESSTNNLLSTLKVFHIARTQKCPVVYASSSAIYGNLPMGDDASSKSDILSPYALDKLVMEKYAKLYAKLYDISTIGLRFFNVYGPKQDPSNPYSGVISIFIDRLLKNKPVTVNGGYQTRDFIYVDDIVEVLDSSMKICAKEMLHQIINVGTGISISIDKLLNILIDIIGSSPEIKYVSLPEGDPERSDGDYKNLENILKININKMTKIKQGLEKTVLYEKNGKVC